MQSQNAQRFFIVMGLPIHVNPSSQIIHCTNEQLTVTRASRISDSNWRPGVRSDLCSFYDKWIGAPTLGHFVHGVVIVVIVVSSTNHSALPSDSQHWLMLTVKAVLLPTMLHAKQNDDESTMTY